MRIGLFEDAGVAALAPLTDTRPAFDLLCGLTSLAAKQRRYFAAADAALFVRQELAALCRLTHPRTAVNDAASLRGGPLVLVNGRWLPPPRRADAAALTSGPHVALIGDEVAYAVLEPTHLARADAGHLADILPTWRDALPHRAAGGKLLTHPWELVEHNGEQIAHDFPEFAADRPTGLRPAGCALLGPAERLLIDPEARVEPNVVIDATRGPVVIEAEAVIASFSRLEGPCYVGPGTHVHSARISNGTSLGRQCRVGGEVEGCIFQGYANKAHEGYIGHSFVGEWVNLGAGTQASDLRLDYSPVSVPAADGAHDIATHRQKVGCYLGDHVKTGIGVLLNSGCRVGPFSQLLPAGRLAPRFVPAFSRATDEVIGVLGDLDRLLVTAAEVLRRRGVALSDGHRAAYRHLFALTSALREGERANPPLRLRPAA